MLNFIVFTNLLITHFKMFQFEVFYFIPLLFVTLCYIFFAHTVFFFNYNSDGSSSFFQEQGSGRCSDIQRLVLRLHSAGSGFLHKFIHTQGATGKWKSEQSPYNIYTFKNLFTYSCLISSAGVAVKFTC